MKRQVIQTYLPVQGEQVNLHRFTLIELLVVIAIIAILAAILMPALSQARERGREATCTSNLKSFNNALMSYADSNNDFLYPQYHAKAIGNVYWYSYRSDWRKLVAGGITQKRWEMGEAGAHVCPSRDPYNADSSLPASFSPRAWSYAHSCHVLGDGKKLWFKLGDSRRPSKLVTWVDSEHYWVGATNFYKCKFNGGYAKCDALAFRHNGKANALCLDGHVTVLRDDYYEMRNTAVADLSKTDIGRSLAPVWYKEEPIYYYKQNKL